MSSDSPEEVFQALERAVSICPSQLKSALFLRRADWWSTTARGVRARIGSDWCNYALRVCRLRGS